MNMVRDGVRWNVEQLQGCNEFRSKAGSSRKSVQHPIALDGGRLEEAGLAVLRGSSVRIVLRPEFAALIDSLHYEVRLESRYRGRLEISRQGPGAFEVRISESLCNRRRTPVPFGYRVIGRRKDLLAPEWNGSF